MVPICTAAEDPRNLTPLKLEAGDAQCPTPLAKQNPCLTQLVQDLVTTTEFYTSSK